MLVADLQDDNKTVILNLDANLNTSDAYAIVVDELDTADGNQYENVRESFVSPAGDNTDPVVESVSATAGSTGTRTVIVEFNEPIDAAARGTYIVNGRTVAATVGATDQRVVTLSLATAVNAGAELSVVIQNAQDFSGNGADETVTATVEGDVGAPTVESAVAQSENKIRVTFSEDVTLASVNDDNNIDVVALGLADVFNAAESVNGSTTVYDVTVNTGTLFANGATTQDLTITIDNVVDSQNNEMAAEQSFDVTLTKDTTAPSLLGVTYNQVNGDTQSQLVLEFDEPVGASTAGTAAAVEGALRVINATTGAMYDVAANINAGVAATDDTHIYNSNDDGDNLTGTGATEYVTVVFDELLPNGTYNATLPANTINDTATVDADAPFGNNAGTFSFVVNNEANVGTLGFDTTPIEYDASTNDDELIVAFDANVGVDATNPSHYLLNGAGLPDDTIIYLEAGNASRVHIELPDGSFETTGAVSLTVQNVVSADETAQMNLETRTVMVEDSVRPVLSNAVYTDAEEITVDASEAIAVYDLSGVSIVDENGNEVVAAGQVSDNNLISNNTKIEITFTAGDLSDKDLSNLFIELPEGALNDNDEGSMVDANGNELTRLAITDEHVDAVDTLAVADNDTSVSGVTGDDFDLSANANVDEPGVQHFVYIVPTNTVFTTDNYTTFQPVAEYDDTADFVSVETLDAAVVNDSMGDVLGANAYDIHVITLDEAGNVNLDSVTNFTPDAE